MKRRNKTILLGLLAVGAMIFTGCAKEKEEVATVPTYADYFESEVFQNVPVMQTSIGQFEEPETVVNNVHIMEINGATLEEYWAYGELLRENGYTKYADNGQEGIVDGAVYNSMFTKDEWTLTLIYYANRDKASITMAKDSPISKHLVYDESYASEIIDGAQTVLHMPELQYQGDCYIIQLKNGHFIINDGGVVAEAEYLVEYLEALVPEGEKPVVELWAISHPHPDHMEAFHAIGSDAELASRLYVEEIVYCSVNKEILEKVGNVKQDQTIASGYRMFKDAEGNKPKVHRPHPGQRYYFADITMDCLFTADLMPFENYRTPDANEASTWWMYTIEGQKFLLGADACSGNEKTMMKLYKSESFDVDIFSVLHHGIATYDEFTNFISVKTLLYPNRHGKGQETGTNQGFAYEGGMHMMHNSLLRSKAQEWMCYGDGGNVLTFPYEVGSAVKVAPRVFEVVEE